MSNDKDNQLAQCAVREWAEHDVNEHYGSHYLRDEFGSERLEERIVCALTTARQAERERAGQIAFAEAVRLGISAERAIAVKAKIEAATREKGEG